MTHDTHKVVIEAIEKASQPGKEQTWCPLADVEVTRQSNGRVQLYFPDHNRALYQMFCTHVQDMVKGGQAKDLLQGSSQGRRAEKWSFSFMPVGKRR